MDRRQFFGVCAGSLALGACGGGGGSEEATTPVAFSPTASGLALGDLICLPIGFQPEGTLECNGQSVYRIEYQALFELLGTTYGSADEYTYTVPTLPPLRPTSGPPAAWYIVADPPVRSSPVRGLTGEVRLFAYEPDPQGAVAAAWPPCDGRTLDIRGHQELFSVIGSAFGGDGVTNFKLPRLASVPAGGPVPLGYRIAATGDYPSLGGDAATPTFEDRIDYLTYLPVIARVAYGASAARLSGFALCAGQTLPIQHDWLPLAAVLGNRYGGDSRTFQLPTVPDSDGLVHVLLYNGIFPPRP